MKTEFIQSLQAAKPQGRIFLACFYPGTKCFQYERKCSPSHQAASSTAQVTQVSIFNKLLNVFWLSVLLYCIGDSLSKSKLFPRVLYLIFQTVFTSLTGKSFRPNPSISPAWYWYFLTHQDRRVLLDTPLTHQEQEILCPGKDENSYLPWHLISNPEEHYYGRGALRLGF